MNGELLENIAYGYLELPTHTVNISSFLSQATDEIQIALPDPRLTATGLPPADAATGLFLVATGGGVIRAANLSFVPASIAPAITSIAPRASPEGTTVTISSRFELATSTAFVIHPNYPCVYFNTTATTIECTLPSLPANTPNPVELIVRDSATGQRMASWIYITPSSIPATVLTALPSTCTQGTVMQLSLEAPDTLPTTGLQLGHAEIGSVPATVVSVTSQPGRSGFQIIAMSIKVSELPSPSQGFHYLEGLVAVYDDDGELFALGSSVQTILLPPAITSIIPPSILTTDRSTRVTILGQRLLGGGTSIQTASLAGVAATIVSASSTQVVVAPGRATTDLIGEVRLVSDTGAYTVRSDGFTYIHAESEAPTLAPSSAPTFAPTQSPVEPGEPGAATFELDANGNVHISSTSQRIYLNGIDVRQRLDQARLQERRIASLEALVANMTSRMTP